ncbi:MAG: hypothetical protein ISR96_07160 [Nitrospira sp.]|nr:hypothetical protein [Nitrospira sp.]
MQISAVNWLIHITVNIALFLSWHIVLYLKRAEISFADRLIAVFILGLLQVLITEMLLGLVFKALFAGPLFLLNISISSIVMFYVRFRHSDGPALIPALKELLQKSRKVVIMMREDILLMLLLSVFVLTGLWIVFTGWLFPGYAWDALWYHMPIAGQILQSGAIEEGQLNSFIDMVVNTMPKNMSLFFLWNIIFLQNDVIVDLTQFAFTLAGVLVIYSIALKCGIRQAPALFSAPLFMFVPVVILQSSTNYVDIAVAVLFLIALNFLLYKEPHKKDLKRAEIAPLPVFIAGSAMGILLGSKASGLIFFAVSIMLIFVQVLIMLYKSENRQADILDAVRLYGLYFLVPVMVAGGFWFVKNWVIYGNPLTPIELRVSDITLFKGLIKGIIDPAPSAIENLTPLGRLIHVWLERVEYYLYDSRLSGFGPLWFILYLPCIALAIVRAVKKDQYNFLFVSSAILFIYLFYPSNWYSRYVIFVVALGPLAFGLVLHYFWRQENVLKIFALFLAIYTAAFSNSPAVTPAKVREFMDRPFSERLLAWQAPFNIDIHARKDYGLWIWITRNIKTGDSIAYAYDPLFLAPLWNSSYSNRIVRVRAEGYKEWQAMLKQEDAGYVIMEKGSIEERWIMKENSALDAMKWMGSGREKFENVYSDDNYIVMKLDLVNKG